MKTRGGIDTALLRRAKRLTRARTDGEVITLGLQALLRSRKREKLIKLLGSGKTNLTLRELKKLRSDA